MLITLTNIQLELGNSATAYYPHVKYSGNYLSHTDTVATIGDHILVADWTPIASSSVAVESLPVLEILDDASITTKKD